jgi:hypothetical protein
MMKINRARSEVLAIELVKTTVFCDTMPCHLVNINTREQANMI